MKNGDFYRMSAALLAALGVILGAFGAHAIKGMLEAAGRPDDLEIWKTAVLYHLVHAAVLAVSGKSLGKAAVVSLWIGVTIFSGSLYLLVGLNIRWLGAITPLGGLGLILGWFLAAWHFRRADSGV
jgi:uncharacterized membrane protein YgdD (TMEM256/DUF423 family)